MRYFWIAMIVAAIATGIYFMAASNGWADDPAGFSPAVVEKPNEPSSAVKVCSDLACKSGFGSGVYIGDSYFLTARHVAAGHVDGYQWTMKADNGRVFKATVVWQMGDVDLALMKVVQAPNAVFTFPSSGLSCDEPFQGQIVTAIGNPADIAFVHMDGKIVTGQQDVGFWKDAYILDMTVAGGFSGGPIFDDAGDVIGLLVGVLSGTNYSIMEPTNKLCGLLPSIDSSID